jgi:hypothetical protein
LGSFDHSLADIDGVSPGFIWRFGRKRGRAMGSKVPICGITKKELCGYMVSKTAVKKLFLPANLEG